MSLNDKIYKILADKSPLATEEIQNLLYEQGIDVHIRTVQRHIDKLIDKEKRVYLFSYDRKKRRPNYACVQGDFYPEGIMNLPEIEKIDFSKLDRKAFASIVEAWGSFKRVELHEGIEEAKFMKEVLRLLLKGYADRYPKITG